ncbi:hypothetical protein [Cypionkella sp. TWP1-2-1b2]|uniref:hypothetical protein n=1 Tax=Cypionkella sp. TWP1-2-1b2 TaxID=2804675 RepID=UPI003CECA7AE
MAPTLTFYRTEADVKKAGGAYFGSTQARTREIQRYAVVRVITTEPPMMTSVWHPPET